MMETNGQGNRDWRYWFKRIGFAGFLFFLIKGLAWIGLAVFAGKALFE